MSKVKGKPTINVREGGTHKYWIEGMLNHELGKTACVQEIPHFIISELVGTLVLRRALGI